MNHTMLPAEWQDQDAILLTWPHKNTDWADQLDDVIEVYFSLAEAILSSQNLVISCEDEHLLLIAQEHLIPVADKSGYQLFCYQVPADDTWARDHGPITVYKNGRATLLDFSFNAWGNKFEANKDDLITSRLVSKHAFPSALYENIDMILEGGSIESDGQGTLLTTRTCLLSETRNALYSQSELENKLKEYLGVSRILWLEHGYLSGDDTDAHIDTLARFCDPKTICYVHCDDQSDEHYAELNAMEAELKDFRTQDNQPYNLVPLPMASAIYDGQKRLPATYANFLICNQTVLVPVYDVPEDDQALAILASCFPDRTITPINCRALIKQHGSLHCITMQLPKGVLL